MNSIGSIFHNSKTVGTNTFGRTRKNPLSFSWGILTPENGNLPSWLSVHSFYLKGSIGWGYVVGDGYSLASIGFGVIEATFSMPKWFGSLSSDSLANPNIYVGVGCWNVNASVGAGISATAEIISGTVGIQFGDSVSIGIKGYLGAGISLDFSNGLKFGVGWGFGYEIAITVDWNKLFN